MNERSDVPPPTIQPVNPPSAEGVVIKTDTELAEWLPGYRHGCQVGSHKRQGGCFNCCEKCNFDQHFCLGCGTPLLHNGLEAKTEETHPDCTDNA